MKSWRRLALGPLASIAAVLIISVFGATSAGRRSYDPSLMASWVQAVGSIAAIIGAIWIANNQHRATIEFAEHQAKAATREFVEACVATVIHAQTILLKVPGPATDDDEALNVFFAVDFRTYQVLDSAANALMVIPPYRLPTQEAVSTLIRFNSSMSEARQVISDMGSLYANPQMGNWRDAAARLEPIREDASEARRALELFLGRDDELHRLRMPES